MTQTTQRTVPAALVAEVQVEHVERLSPSFVRVTFGAPALADLSTADGFDTRFKIVFPGPTGRLPEAHTDPEAWRDSWLSMADAERSPMRTYTIRETRTVGSTVHLVTDFVVHDADDDAAEGHWPTAVGPACRWALSARPGDIVHIVGPHRLTPIYGGTEFEPGSLRDLLLIGDATAAPAIARILADVGPGFTGQAFIEVPTAADLLELPPHDSITVTWLPRGHAAPGRRLVSAVRDHLGLPVSETEAPLPAVTTDLDIDVWETPRYSSGGEDIDAQLTRAPGRDLAGTYTWIAGESWAVRSLRRTLVTELEVDRARVAFMGYWREGVAMHAVVTGVPSPRT